MPNCDMFYAAEICPKGFVNRPLRFSYTREC